MTRHAPFEPKLPGGASAGRSASAFFAARGGFTLLELMIAVIILGGALTVLYRAIIVNARMVSVSRDRQEVAYVFSLGELAYPLSEIEDIEEDAPVDPDASLKEGYTYERILDEKEDPEEGVTDDGLYVLRTVVTWGNGANREEVVRYIRKTE